MADKIRGGIRSFLRINPSQKSIIILDEGMDFLTNCTKNRVWYNGRSTQLSQLYSQLGGTAVSASMFWAAPMTRGMEIRKLHTGTAKMVIDVLSEIVANDYNGAEISDEAFSALWEVIARKNDFDGKLLKKAVREVCIVGDGAFKLSYDKSLGDKPIIEWYPAERVRFVYVRGVIREVRFYTEYTENSRSFQFCESYGFGFIRYSLFDDRSNEVPLNTLTQTAWAQGEGIEFDSRVMFAVPVVFGEHQMYSGRGVSLIDSKDDAGDALDEVFSQWMDALRAGRSKEYIPESLCPRNPETGEILRPNPFDNRYIAIGETMSENGGNTIHTETPLIQHESYLSAYITALDLYLQGLVSPSTLGIDTKKLDNADAQREKEKNTLYTRQKLVELVSGFVPALVKASLNFEKIVILGKKPLGDDFEVKARFGEYANPSFESQVETVSKARAGGVMSVETSLDEMYGDSKDSAWKEQEARRIKEENGIVLEPEASEIDDVQ